MTTETRYAQSVPTHSPRLHRYTFRDYLDLEETSSVRHEFLEGEIYGMAGGTPEHAALTMSAGAALLAAARGGPCRVHSSDLRVRVLATGLVTYPDVTVVCGPYETDPDSPTTITNPRVVVEVTSDSTEEYDRGEKLERPGQRFCARLGARHRRDLRRGSRSVGLRCGKPHPTVLTPSARSPQQLGGGPKRERQPAARMKLLPRSHVARVS
jgi:Uma2 family endonuclease